MSAILTITDTSFDMVLIAGNAGWNDGMGELSYSLDKLTIPGINQAAGADALSLYVATGHLVVMKKRKSKEIKDFAMGRVLEGYIHTDGNTYDTDNDSLQLVFWFCDQTVSNGDGDDLTSVGIPVSMKNASARLSMAANRGVYFDKDNNPKDFLKSEFVGFANAMGDYIGTVVDKMVQKQFEIQALLTVDEVNNFDITAGWPTNE